MSPPVPVLRGQGPALLPALPALGRCVPRRAVQYRFLRAAHDDGGSGHGIEGRRLRALARRCSPLSRPSGAGAAAALSPPAAAAENGAQSGRDRSLRFPLRGFCARRLRPASAHQSQGGGVSGPRAPIALVLVAAVAENGVIGQGGVMPWRLKSDMQGFRATTWGKPV